MRYAALLRGVNLGPSRRMPMAELREALEDAGFESVATYLQSGNAVFEAEADVELRTRLETAISERFGMEVGVVVVSAAEMGRVVEGCPYRAQADAEPTKVHVTFVDPPPDTSLGDEVDRQAFFPDEFEVGTGVIYMHLPAGMGRSKLPAALDRAGKGRLATTRNWRTVLALVEMLE